MNYFKIDIDFEIGERVFHIDMCKAPAVNAKDEYRYYSKPLMLKKDIEQWLEVYGEDSCHNRPGCSSEESLGRALIEEFDLEWCEIWSGEPGRFSIRMYRPEGNSWLRTGHAETELGIRMRRIRKGTANAK